MLPEQVEKSRLFGAYDTLSESCYDPRFLTLSTCLGRGSVYGISVSDMPRIANKVLDSVGFLYRTYDEAKKHAKIGGTCFLVGQQIVLDGVGYNAYVPYAVTNRHVVWAKGAPVIRINRRDGNPPEIIDKECDQWYPHPEGDDIAVLPLFDRVDQAIHKISYANTDQFITGAFISDNDLGIGDEVFMSGRFINHQGKFHNQAAARFGSISMMPEPILNNGIGKYQLSYAVEMRSRTGFSGSPVFAYRKPWTVLWPTKTSDFIGLLGVNWGYILDDDGENTWLNGVVPAWKIIETLEIPELKEYQKVVSETYRTSMQDKNSGGAVPAAASAALATDENPHHLEDFSRLVDVAARKRSRDDQS
jgi:hypothetical protein